MKTHPVKKYENTPCKNMKTHPVKTYENKQPAPQITTQIRQYKIQIANLSKNQDVFAKVEGKEFL